MRMRLAPLGVAKPRRVSRAAAERDSGSLGPSAPSATAARGGGKPGSSWHPLLRTSYWKAGRGGAWPVPGAAGRGSVSVRSRQLWILLSMRGARTSVLLEESGGQKGDPLFLEKEMTADAKEDIFL